MKNEFIEIHLQIEKEKAKLFTNSNIIPTQYYFSAVKAKTLCSHVPVCTCEI
jgi:hypothetical protein